MSKFANHYNTVLNAAKPGHSTDPVSAETQKGKTLLGVKHGIVLGAEYLFYVKSIATCAPTFFGYVISVLASVP